jgi:hypothetical protein
MDRNPNDSFDRSQTGLGTGPAGSTPGTNVLHESGTTGDQGSAQSAGAFAAGSGTAGLTGGSEQGTARHGADAVKDKLGRVRERATHFKSTLADRLESGADRLRQRSQGSGAQGTMGALDTTAGAGDTRVQGNREAMQKVGGAVANGMQNTAQWLRNADMQSMRSDVETQVRSNPGRSLLVALGVGWVLGRIFRGGQGGGHGRRS